LNAEKSVCGHVKKVYNFVVFLTESYFTWQLDVKGFSQKRWKISY